MSDKKRKLPKCNFELLLVIMLTSLRKHQSSDKSLLLMGLTAVARLMQQKYVVITSKIAA